MKASDLFEQVFDGSLCRESDSPVQNPQNQVDSLSFQCMYVLTILSTLQLQ